jgi:hypothetical protein
MKVGRLAGAKNCTVDVIGQRAYVGEYQGDRESSVIKNREVREAGAYLSEELRQRRRPLGMHRRDNPRNRRPGLADMIWTSNWEW